jgi:hypothetical protein
MGINPWFINDTTQIQYMRAFIFSLDAFVAFTLALLAIYSLIFFSSVPSAYYYLLTQAHYLSRDTLLALSTSQCTPDYGSCAAQGSVLESIVTQNSIPLRTDLIRSTVGVMVPPQFGYSLEMSGDEGSNWDLLYDTADYGSTQDPHAKNSKKLSVSTQVMVFGFGGKVLALQTSPYRYTSCDGAGIMGDEGASGTGSQDTVDFGIITCGQITQDGGGGGATETKNIGNMHPRDFINRGDLVPASDAKIVKLTVYL